MGDTEIEIVKLLESIPTSSDYLNRFHKVSDYGTSSTILFLTPSFISHEDVKIEDLCLDIDLLDIKISTMIMVNKIHVGYLLSVPSTSKISSHMILTRRSGGRLLPDFQTTMVYSDKYFSVLLSKKNLTSTIIANIPMTMKGITTWRQE